MLLKIVFAFVTVTANLSMAEVKPMGSVQMSMCGQNQIRQNGPGVSNVCFAQVIGDRKSQYLTVTINGGIAGGTYIYQYSKSKTFVDECQQTASGLACLKTYQLVGTLGLQNRIVLFAGGRLETVAVYTVNGTTLKSKFLGNEFETKAMKVVFQTQ